MKTCLALENSGLPDRGHHAEHSAIRMYSDHRPRGQSKAHQTHPNHDKQVEAIEKDREYLAEVRFDQGDNKRQGTSYRNQLRKDISRVSSQTSTQAKL
jgi:hypothetical protein